MRAFVGDKPYAVGPSAIGMRDNPYGDGRRRQPRQHPAGDEPQRSAPARAARRGLDLGYFAHFARGGARPSPSAALVGPFGWCTRRPAWPQPWFDADGGLYPVYHVLRGLAGLARWRSSRGRDHRAAGGAGGGRPQAKAILWLVNLIAEPQRVTLEASPNGHARAARPGSFVAAADDPELSTSSSESRSTGDAIELGPYAWFSSPA